jgi:hypothetical protein
MTRSLSIGSPKSWQPFFEKNDPQGSLISGDAKPMEGQHWLTERHGLDPDTGADNDPITFADDDAHLRGAVR